MRPASRTPSRERSCEAVAVAAAEALPFARTDIRTYGRSIVRACACYVKVSGDAAQDGSCQRLCSLGT